MHIYIYNDNNGENILFITCINIIIVVDINRDIFSNTNININAIIYNACINKNILIN